MSLTQGIIKLQLCKIVKDQHTQTNKLPLYNMMRNITHLRAQPYNLKLVSTQAGANKGSSNKNPWVNSSDLFVLFLDLCICILHKAINICLRDSLVLLSCLNHVQLLYSARLTNREERGWGKGVKKLIHHQFEWLSPNYGQCCFIVHVRHDILKGTT